MTKLTIPICKDSFTKTLMTIVTLGLMTFMAGIIYFAIGEIVLPIAIILTVMILFVECMLVYMILLVWGKESLMECSNPFKFKC